MKNQSPIMALISALLLLAVGAYFGFQTWQYFTAPDNTVPVYAYQSERTVTMNGSLVRDEELIECGETLLELKRAEGERVGKNKVLATVYRSAQSLEAARQLSDLTEQLDQLKDAQAAARDSESAMRMDGDLEGDLVALRAAVSAENYSALEGSVSALKTAVLRREYATQGASDISGHIEALENQIAALSGSIGDTARVVTAPFAGTYSAVADGYESVLRPEALENMSPAAFEALRPDGRSSTVGKLIRGNKWYYAACITPEDAALLVRNRTYSLDITGVDMALPVRLYSLSPEQNGKVLAVLQSDEYLSYVTMLRSQSAELILESYSGLRVPKNAVRIGEDGSTGVFCRIGRQSYFKPVNILYQGEDYCLVSPGKIEAKRDSDFIFSALRAGDEVIISSNELFNGKVVN